MIIGYARASTLDQAASLGDQQLELVSAGCVQIFTEQVYSVDMVNRKNLEQAIKFARKGDTLVVTKLDRLARSVDHLARITERLANKDVALRILDGTLDTSIAEGRLALKMLTSISQFTHEIMLERQRERIAKAQTAGRLKGRAPTALAKADEIMKLAQEGVKPLKIAKKLGIGQFSVNRIILENTYDSLLAS